MATRTFLSALVILLLTATSTPGAEKLRAGTVFKESALYSLPMLAAEEKGFWKEQGLEVEWVPFTGGAPMAQAMAAGAIDAGMTATFSSILQIARGVPKVIVADMGSREDMYVWVRPGSPLKGARDLKGTTIGINRFGSLAEGFSRLLSKALGVEYQKDIKFVALGSPTNLAAGVKIGQVQATLMDFFSMAPLKYQGELKELVAMRDYLPKKWTDAVIVARRDYVDKNPDSVKKTVIALFKSFDLILKNPQWSADKMKSFLGYSDELARGVYQALQYGKEGRVDPEVVQNVINFTVEYGLLPKDQAPPVERTYKAIF